MANFLSHSSHVTCQNRIRPFTEKHGFIAQLSYTCASKTLRPELGYRVPDHAACYHFSTLIAVILDLTVYKVKDEHISRNYTICANCFNIRYFDVFTLFQSMKLPIMFRDIVEDTGLRSTGYQHDQIGQAKYGRRTFEDQTDFCFPSSKTIQFSLEIFFEVFTIEGKILENTNCPVF